LEHAELRLGDAVAARSAYNQSMEDEFSATKALGEVSDIGIYQPCCMLCPACFAAVGKASVTRGYHKKPVKNWAWPLFIRADKNALKVILGQTVMDLIGESKENLELVLRIVAQNHNNWE